MYQRNDLRFRVGIPNWFTRFLPVEPIVGRQELYKGINQIWLLELEIHPNAFYQFVWRQFLDILLVTLFVGVIAWAMGIALINIVLKPILAVKNQASAVTNKHFTQITDHSGIAEFE